MIQVQIRIQFKSPFETRLTYAPRASFLREETHEAHSFIYSIFLAPPKRGIHLYLYRYSTWRFAPLSTYANLGATFLSRHLHLYWCTGTVSKCVRRLAPFAPLLMHLNCIQVCTQTCAICTSIDALKLYPSAYADLKKIQVRMQRIQADRGGALVRTVLRATGIDSFQKKESVGFGTQCTEEDSFQKKESVGFGTQCTEERKILAFWITFHFSFFPTKSS
jgi:hypothetical protein